MITISLLDVVMIYWIWWIQQSSFWENSNITKLITFFLDLFNMPRDVSSKRLIIFGCNEATMSIHVSPVMKTWRIQRYLKNNMGKQTKNIDIYSFCYVRLDICFWRFTKTISLHFAEHLDSVCHPRFLLSGEVGDLSFIALTSTILVSSWDFSLL